MLEIQVKEKLRGVDGEVISSVCTAENCCMLKDNQDLCMHSTLLQTFHFNLHTNQIILSTLLAEKIHCMFSYAL